MIDFLKRLLGIAPARPAAPVSGAPVRRSGPPSREGGHCCGSCGGGRRPAPRAARLEAVLQPGRADAGVMLAYDAAGSVVGGPWPVLSKADPALGARRGNPGLDWRRACGETPTGAYEVVSRIKDHPRSMGPHEALMLRALSGQAATAEAGGRGLLLIHGGRPGSATDGSLRVPDGAMAEILGLLPDDPSTAIPPVRVVVKEAAADSLHVDGTPSWHWDGSCAHCDDDMLGFLAMVYLWDAMTDDYGHAAADAQAAEAIQVLGYQPLPDGDAPQAGAPADGTGCLVAEPTADDRREQPLPEGTACQPEAAAPWAPSGGAYDR